LFEYALLGGLAGLGATLFVQGLLALRSYVKSASWLPRWAGPAVGGVTMAAIGLSLPQTFGIGYPTLSAALLGGLSWRRMAVLSIGKGVATIMSYGWGLSGGIFAPSLFIGAMLGGTVAHMVHPFAGPGVESVGSFALVGMGASLRARFGADYVDPDYFRADRRLRDHPAADDCERHQLHRCRPSASSADLRRAAQAGRRADARTPDAS
jgi:H+/Cl- antiporter ClcA